MKAASRRALALALLLTACGASAASGPPSGGGAPGPVAAHDEVCHAHDGSLDRPCAAGLECCYPCGVDGCDSVCHTPAECRVDMVRP